MRVKGKDGQLLREPLAVRRRWREHFADLLHAEEKPAVELLAEAADVGQGMVERQEINSFSFDLGKELVQEVFNGLVGSPILFDLPGGRHETFPL